MTPNSNPPKPACQICGTPMDGYNFEGFYKCPACSFVTAGVTLTKKQAEQLYCGRYFNGEEYADYVSDEALIKKNFQDRMRTLLRFVPDPGAKSLFEIGSAYGFFLETAAKHFGKTAGIDITREGVEFAVKRGNNEFKGEFLKFNKLGKTDVFCMWDTIEHLSKPAEYIKKIAAHTKTGGLLAITTGDIASFNAKFRGARWRQIHPPTHLHYFSVKSLTYLLNRNGYEVVYAGHPGQYANLGNIFKIMFVIRSRNEALYNFLKGVGLAALNIYFNMFDLVYIIARKVR